MRLCVIGDPVGHSLSPLLHRRMLDRAGLTGSYETVTVTPDTLPEFLAAARAGAGAQSRSSPSRAEKSRLHMALHLLQNFGELPLYPM